MKKLRLPHKPVSQKQAIKNAVKMASKPKHPALYGLDQSMKILTSAILLGLLL